MKNSGHDGLCFNLDLIKLMNIADPLAGIPSIGVRLILPQGCLSLWGEEHDHYTRNVNSLLTSLPLYSWLKAKRIQ